MSFIEAKIEKEGLQNYEGKIDTTLLITHRFKLADVEEVYRIFKNRLDGVIKIAITE